MNAVAVARPQSRRTSTARRRRWSRSDRPHVPYAAFAADARDVVPQPDLRPGDRLPLGVGHAALEPGRVRLAHLDRDRLVVFSRSNVSGTLTALPSRTRGATASSGGRFLIAKLPSLSAVTFPSRLGYREAADADRRAGRRLAVGEHHPARERDRLEELDRGECVGLAASTFTGSTGRRAADRSGRAWRTRPGGLEPDRVPPGRTVGGVVPVLVGLDEKLLPRLRALPVRDVHDHLHPGDPLAVALSVIRARDLRGRAELRGHRRRLARTRPRPARPSRTRPGLRARRSIVSSYLPGATVGTVCLRRSPSNVAGDVHRTGRTPGPLVRPSRAEPPVAALERGRVRRPSTVIVTVPGAASFVSSSTPGRRGPPRLAEPVRLHPVVDGVRRGRGDELEPALGVGLHREPLPLPLREADRRGRPAGPAAVAASV